MTHRLFATLAAAVAFAFASPAQSGVIVDSFGPGNTYDAESAWLVGKTGIDYALVAASFTLPADGIVDDVAVAAIANNFTLVITADDAGFPGSVLATISTGFTVNGYIEFDPFVALSAGTYWLQMAAPSDAPFGGWYPNDHFFVGDVRQSWDNGETWAFSGLAFTYPALRIGVSDARGAGAGNVRAAGGRTCRHGRADESAQDGAMKEDRTA